ncbi:MAG: hypothetical protein AB8H03_23395 [Saprospiraceae bacterium]
MKQEWLDKNLDDKLGDYDSPMDLESAWESLQAKREEPKKKKKNRFFFFWVIFGLFTIGVGGSHFFFNNGNDHTYINTIPKLEDKLENENQHFGKIEKASPTPLNSKNTTLQNVDKNITTKTKTIQNTRKNKSFENQNYSTPKNAKTNVDANPLFSKTKNNAVSDVNLDSSEKSNENFISPNQDEANKAITIDSTIPQREVQPIAVLFLPSLEPNLLNLSRQENLEILNPSYAGIPILYPPTASTPNYFGIAAGYGIHSKGQVLPQENSLDAITVNAFYEHRFGRTNWFFKTGINYDQFIKKMETTTELPFSEEDDDQLITVNHFKNGTVQNIYGVADVSKIEKTTSKNFNRYRLISIPMIMGYDLISLNRASLQVEGGIARSIFGFHSGKDFDLIDSDFEKRGVWQGLYGLNFNFRTGTRTNIFTSLKGNYHFNNIGKSDQLDMEKFRLQQIQIGLKFRL